YGETGGVFFRDTLDLSAFAGAASVRVGFIVTASDQPTIFIVDDVSVMEKPRPGAFGKSAPINGSGAPESPTIQWSESEDASSYEYCVDTTNNDTCDGTWTST